MAEYKNPDTDTQSTDEAESQFDVQFFLRMAWYLRYWIILSVVVCMGIAFLYLKTKTDTYATQMMILITTDKNAGMSNSAQMSFIQDMTGISSFNSLDNEKVIIRSTPVVQKVVEAQHLNIRYYAEQTFRHVETLSQEVRMDYIPRPGYNVNNLPLITVEYDLQDTVRMSLSIIDSSRKRGGSDGYILTDSIITLPGTVSLPRYGTLIFSYQSMVHDEYAESVPVEPSDGFSYMTPGKHYIKLYSPQARAQEICSSMAVEVVEEGGRSSSLGGAGSSILKITLSDNIPQRAESLLEGIVAQYNVQTKEYYTLSYTNTMEFIQNRLTDLKGQLDGVEGRMKEFSIGNNVYDIQSQATFSLNTDMQRQQRVQEIDVQISLLEMVERELQEQRDYATIPSNIGITDNTILSSIVEYNRLCVERLRLLSSATESSPAVKQLGLQLQARRDLIFKTVRNQKSILTSQHNELTQQIGRSQDDMRRLPSQRLTLGEIEREQSIIEPLYVLLQKKREETMLAIIAEPDIARIVEHAENNTFFTGPNRRKFYLIALFLGLVLPVAIYYVKILLKTKITTPDDITSRTSTPIIGIVPLSKTRITKASDIIAQSSTNTTTEVFRSIRSSLTFTESKVFQVTSSIPSEGKSFVSTNLALCFASANKRTILVETDMRKGHQRRTFEVPQDFKHGLSEYLSGKVDQWQDLLYHVPGIEGMDVMLKGPIPPNPNELLSSNRLERLIAELREAYDYVILDSPPYLLIADPITINRVADLNIYVMRAGVSDLRFINEVRMAVSNEKLTKPYIVLNGLDLEAQSYYGHSRYGYGYGYAYGYSYGYSDRAPERSFWSRFRPGHHSNNGHRSH
ncbi:MAG: polysaccharide biosynthesis tyrosine autokinase [Bacteroidales bacterium]|nr:polysaccharide biosynthesis tyrosine autokinase [Bacteroidales bacterium]